MSEPTMGCIEAEAIELRKEIIEAREALKKATARVAAMTVKYVLLKNHPITRMDTYLCAAEDLLEKTAGAIVVEVKINDIY